MRSPTSLGWGLGTRLWSALTIPQVSVCSSPNGFPIAKALCPTWKSAEVSIAIDEVECVWDLAEAQRDRGRAHPRDPCRHEFTRRDPDAYGPAPAANMNNGRGGVPEEDGGRLLCAGTDPCAARLCAATRAV